MCQVGFSKSNIRALCDVGRTTKKHTVGYIGQKGIGFKSVFKITDAPQIHSRGFHVAFDLMQHSALGYVLPTWVEDTSDTSSVSKLGSRQTSTKVFLPFKKVCSSDLADKTCSTTKADSHVTLTGGRLLADCAHVYNYKHECCINAVLRSIFDLRTAHVQSMSHTLLLCTMLKHEVLRMICRVHNSRQQPCAISLMMCVPPCSFSFSACSV